MHANKHANGNANPNLNEKHINNTSHFTDRCGNCHSIAADCNAGKKTSKENASTAHFIEQIAVEITAV